MRLEHERAWEALAAAEGLPLNIFRLGGEAPGVRGCGCAIRRAVPRAPWRATALRLLKCAIVATQAPSLAAPFTQIAPLLVSPSHLDLYTRKTPRRRAR